MSVPCPWSSQELKLIVVVSQKDGPSCGHTDRTQKGLPGGAELVFESAAGDDVTGILEKRLRELESKIQALKDQQQVILKLLKNDRSSVEIGGRIQGMDRKNMACLKVITIGSKRQMRAHSNNVWGKSLYPGL